MRTFLRGLLILVLILPALGCQSILVERINEKFPPVSSEERQRQAIDVAIASLGTVAHADAYVALDDDTLEAWLAKAIKEKEPRIESVTFRASQQEIVAELNFDGDFPEAHASIGGVATVRAAVTVDDQTLMVQPSVSSMRIRRAKVKEGTDLEAALPLINAVLRTFLDNVNGTIAAQRFPLRFDALQSFKPADFFRNVPGIRKASGSDVNFAVSLQKSAVLIDRDGVHVLVQLGPTTSAAAPELVSSSGDIESRHRELAGNFRKRVEFDLGPISSRNWARTLVLISKSYLAGSLNRSLGGASLCVEYGVPPVKEHFNQVIRTDPATDLKCRTNVRNCSPTRDCSATRDCSRTADCTPNWGCPDCGVFDGVCHARRLGCEADKVRYRKQCELEAEGRRIDCERIKEQERVACEIAKEAERIDCERLKAMEIAGCEINQAWLNAWGSYEVGRVEGDVSLVPVGTVCIRGLKVSPDLSRVELSASVAAAAPVNASLKFTPYNLANIACMGQWSGNIAATARVDDQTLNLAATMAGSKDGETVQLELTSATSKIAGRIEPPPLAALVSQNPSFLIQCAPLAGAAGIAGLIDPKNDPFSQNKFEIPIPIQKLPLQIKPVNLAAGGLSLSLAPSIAEKAIQFVTP